MTDRVINAGKHYGMEMNMEKTKVVSILKQPSPE
jgi:hypothetical protein